MSTQTGAQMWLSVKELAERTRISKRTIYDLAKAGKIPSRRLPGTTTVRFAPADVAAIEKASARGGVAA